MKKALLTANFGSRQTKLATSSHNGVRFFCRLPRRQVAKSLPTASHVAGGKVFFADIFFVTSSLLTVSQNAVGKAFADCFSSFAGCLWQSAKWSIPVVRLVAHWIQIQEGYINLRSMEAISMCDLCVWHRYETQLQRLAKGFYKSGDRVHLK